MASPFALSTVERVLRDHGDAAALRSLGWLITSFLGPDPNMSLREACTFGSTALLDWIWGSSCTSAADRRAEWSLTNFLRSDEHYKLSQFAAAARVAAKRGDLPVLQWLFAHFPSREVLPSVVYAAAVEGHLEVVQFLLDHADGSFHRVKKRKVVRGNAVVQSATIRATGLAGTLGKAVRVAFRRGHYTIARWIYEHEYCDQACQADAEVMCRALDIGGTELAELLAFSDSNLETYTDYRLRDELVGPLLKCCRVGECAARAMTSLAILGRLELMQQVAQRHPPLAQVGWAQHWQRALKHACERDDVPMLRWLISRPHWSELDGTELELQMGLAFTRAARTGSMAAMEYLHSRGIVANDRSVGVLMGPIRNGHLGAVEWLLEHGWSVGSRDARQLMYEAAKYGHLEMMQLFQTMAPSDSDGQRGANATRTTWRANDFELAVAYGDVGVAGLDENRPDLDGKLLFSVAARYGRLEVMQWLYTNDQYNRLGLSALRSAAEHGHVEVVRWMLSMPPTHSKRGLLDSAADSNNVELVQWLHESTDASCTTDAMDFAARNGNLAMLKWLLAHRSEGCTAKAIEYALGLDDTRVASWLVTHFPEHRPQNVRLSCQLEVLLFVRAHFPHLLQPEASRQGTTIIRGLESCSADARAWLKENYGGQTFRSARGRDITF